jgi:hypothetical protein
LYTFLKNYEHDDDCFIKSYATDLTKIEQTINEKKKRLGLNDAEIKWKLRDIDLKLREIGGKLEVPLL